MDCEHIKTRAIYEQRPPSEGRKLARVGSRCESCKALLHAPVKPSWRFCPFCGESITEEPANQAGRGEQ